MVLDPDLELINWSVEELPHDKPAYRFTITMNIGPDSEPYISDSPNAGLLARVVRKRVLEPGDVVVEPGVNGSEDVRGTVLHHDTVDSRVAWKIDDGGVRISDRDRLLRRLP